MIGHFDNTLKSLHIEFRSLLESNPELVRSVQAEINDASQQTAQALKTQSPYDKHQSQLLERESSFPMVDDHCTQIRHSLAPFAVFLNATKRPGLSFWQQKVEEHEKVEADAKLTHEHLLQHWRKEYGLAYAAWEQEMIERCREDLLKRLTEWLEQLSELADVIESLGLEPGRLLDFSQGQMSYSDLDQLKRWLEYISSDEGVRQLCDLMGKLRQASHSEELELVERTQSYQRTEIDVNSKEEIIGIRLGKDLEHILPSELALLSDPETSILFDLKYTEARLMCFDLVGMQSLTEEVTVMEEESVQVEDEKGPIVICVDTSGSMHGSPETIAKALTLYLTSEARKDDRKCYLINFSTCIETLDLSDGYSFQTLLQFLKNSFHGGTDVAPAIHHGIEIMQNDDYKNADMLIISDFIMADLPEDTTEAISALQESGKRFYSICIGEAFMSHRLKDVFDREWVYDPNNSGITELVNYQNQLSSDMHSPVELTNE